MRCLCHLWRKSRVMPATTAVASTQPNAIRIQVKIIMNSPQPFLAESGSQ